MATKKTGLKTASVLAFERKIDPSDALMYSGSWSERKNLGAWTPVNIREKSVRGTISNRLKATEQDPAKLDAQIDKPNLQTVDVATLPHDADTLLVRFSLRVLPGTGEPSACNDASYQKRLGEVVQDYVERVGFAPLARRYATNIANGRFVWRNRMGAEAVEVRVDRMQNGAAASTWTFDGLGISLRDFDSQDDGITQLANVIEEGLRGDAHVLLDVRAFVRVGTGQEVFPSQELILDKAESKKSKTLYVVDGVAGIHSQKIGNALRTIDTWYPRGGNSVGAIPQKSLLDALEPSDDDNVEMGPIAVEPYGSVTTQGKAYRQPKAKADFYTLLDRWALLNEVPELEQQHFVMAVLVRGGVFGDAG